MNGTGNGKLCTQNAEECLSYAHGLAQSIFNATIQSCHGCSDGSMVPKFPTRKVRFWIPYGNNRLIEYRMAVGFNWLLAAGGKHVRTVSYTAMPTPHNYQKWHHDSIASWTGSRSTSDQSRQSGAGNRFRGPMYPANQRGMRQASFRILCPQATSLSLRTCPAFTAWPCPGYQRFRMDNNVDQVGLLLLPVNNR